MTVNIMNILRSIMIYKNFFVLIKFFMIEEKCISVNDTKKVNHIYLEIYLKLLPTFLINWRNSLCPKNTAYTITQSNRS